MTMIIGIISQSGIILGSDTRCMVGNRGKFVGHHERARKIVFSSEMTATPIACAIACSSSMSFGESPIGFAQSWLSEHRFLPDTLLNNVHDEFEQRFNVLNEQLPSEFTISSIFAKFTNGIPVISFGSLKKQVEVKMGRGMFCYPEVSILPFETNVPNTEDAIAFLKEAIIHRASPHGAIGSEIDIIKVSETNVEWIQGQDRHPLPTHASELYAEYQKDPSIITPKNERISVDKWLKNR